MSSEPETRPVVGEPAIVIENVSKAFSIFKRPADRLLQMLSGAPVLQRLEAWQPAQIL